MNKKPMVSIVVPCFNQGRYLNKNLQSVFEQSYSHWECLIIDDGSEDSTKEVSESWAKKDTRFKYFYKENGGLASARNYGLDKASGNFIQFLDADDFIHKDKFRLSIEKVKVSMYNQIIISDYRQFNNFTGTIEIPHFRMQKETINFENILFNWDNNFAIPIHCGLFSFELFIDFRFREDLKAKEDWLMWVSFFKKDISVLYIDKPLAYYRRHDANMTNKVNMTKDHLKAFRYLRNEISDDQYARLLELRFERMSNTIFSLRDQIKRLRSSFGWRLKSKFEKIFKV